MYEFYQDFVPPPPVKQMHYTDYECLDCAVAGRHIPEAHGDSPRCWLCEGTNLKTRILWRPERQV